MAHRDMRDARDQRGPAHGHRPTGHRTTVPTGPTVAPTRRRRRRLPTGPTGPTVAATRRRRRRLPTVADVRVTPGRVLLRPTTVLVVLALIALVSLVVHRGATTLAAGREESFAPIAGESPPPEPTVADALVTRLAEQAETAVPGAQISIAVVPLGSGRLSTSGGDRMFKSASAAKAWFAAAALQRASIDEVEPHAAATFAESSDFAAGHLIELAGGPDAVNRFTLDQVGMTHTALERWVGETVVEASGIDGRMQGSNYTTTEDMATFLRELHAGELLDAPKTAALLEWMQLSPRSQAVSDYGGRLPDLLPPAVQAGVAHKAGWLLPEDDGDFWLLDFGIVAPARAEPYAIVIAGMTGDAFVQLKQFVSEASCEAYRTMGDDPTWSCPRPDRAP